MKKYVLLLLLLQWFPSVGQTFVDCFERFNSKYNDVSSQYRTKNIDLSALESAIFTLEESLDSCIIGKEIPQFNFVGHSGKNYTNETLKGKVVVFNFWSVNCAPCVGEIPVLNRIHLSYRDNVDFVLISILVDKAESFQKFLEGGLTKRRIIYEVATDSKDLIKNTFKLGKVYPTNLFVDREGKIFMKTTGGIIDPKHEQTLEAKFRAILDRELKEGKRL